VTYLAAWYDMGEYRFSTHETLKEAEAQVEYLKGDGLSENVYLTEVKDHWEHNSDSQLVDSWARKFGYLGDWIRGFQVDHPEDGDFEVVYFQKWGNLNMPNSMPQATWAQTLNAIEELKEDKDIYRIEIYRATGAGWVKK